MAKTVDGPLDECLARYRGLLDHPKYLRRFCLSRVGRRPPMYMVASVADDGVPAIGNYPSACPAGVPEVDWQLGNVDLWRANLRAVISQLAGGEQEPVYLASAELLVREWLDTALADDGSCPDGGAYDDWGVARPAPSAILRATLESIWYFLGFLDTLRPTAGKNNDDEYRENGGARWESLRLLDNTTHHLETSFCELCWRPTIRSQRLGSQVDPYFRERGVTDRFCSIHDPSDPKSSYQTDRHYHRLFWHELSAMRGRGRSAYGIRFDCPVGVSEETVRKTAYDLIHAFPIRRSFTSFEDMSLAERVFVLRQHGQRNIAIARELDVSKQAVSKAWKKLTDLGTARANEKRVYPDTHEAFTLAKGRSSKLFADVRRLRKQGVTTAQIASQLHYFKHTVKAVYRRLDDEPLSRLGRVRPR